MKGNLMSDINDTDTPEMPEGAAPDRDPPTREELVDTISVAFGPTGFNYKAHIAAIETHVRWLTQRITEQVADANYTIAAAVTEAVQIDELRSAVAAADKVAKALRDSYSGYFAQYLFDQKLKNAKVETSDHGNRLVYQKETTSYSIDDPITLTAHLVANPNDMQLLTLKLAAAPTREFIKTHNGALPPGASSYSETKAYLRKST